MMPNLIMFIAQYFFSSSTPFHLKKGHFSKKRDITLLAGCWLEMFAAKRPFRDKSLERKSSFELI